jgi:opacity protein-like surface antigen
MAIYRQSARISLRHLAATVGAVGALALATGTAQAGVPGVDVYMGVGVGQSNADVSAGDLPSVSNFDKKDTGWKVFFGGRFVSMFGAELDYIDFGKPSGGGAEIKYKALAGFGMFYVPLPLPILDVYAKAGVARLNSDLRVTSSSFNTKDTKFAYGAGVQLKFGSFAIRGEYEQFKVDGTKPTMLSVGFSKSFL